MATSPTDHNNSNILAWLDRLQASVRSAGAQGGPRAFKLDARGTENANDDSDQEESDPVNSRLTHAQRYGLVPVDADDEGNADVGADGEDGEDADKLQSSLPDSHVPLGLIANLSLSNNAKVRSTKKEGKEETLGDENLDDDNVVCSAPYSGYSRRHACANFGNLLCSIGRGERDILHARCVSVHLTCVSIEAFYTSTDVRRHVRACYRPGHPCHVD